MDMFCLSPLSRACLGKPRCGEPVEETPEAVSFPVRLRPRFQPVGLPGRMLGDYALSESETGGSSLQLGEKDAHTRGPPEADS